ncbi:MAG: hypothetical protein JRJ29_17420 [Deltaproteobacteria bacterium]|nr:hypothetical protein [Deltaproteobacteria bacterium]
MSKDLSWEPWPIEFTSDFIPGAGDIRKEIRDRIMGVAATDSWLRENPPPVEGNWVYAAEIDENEPIAQTAMEAARELGIESKPAGTGSLTDGVHLINYSGIPAISIGPAGVPHTGPMNSLISTN